MNLVIISNLFYNLIVGAATVFLLYAGVVLFYIFLWPIIIKLLKPVELSIKNIINILTTVGIFMLTISGLIVLGNLVKFWGSLL